MEDLEKYISQSLGFIINSLPALVMALLVLLTGLWGIKKISKMFRVTLESSGFTVEIISFLATLANIGMKILLIVSVAGMIGINTAALVGVVAATGLAVGLALQGSLGNFAAGIIIITFKPYKVGDWIEVKDKFGKVTDIQIFNTIVVTPGNKTLIIPNGEVINGIITNYSKRGNIRIDLKVSLPYSEDFPKFKHLLMNDLLSMDSVLKVPVPEIGIESFGAHHLIISVRPYVHPDMYWTVYYEVMSGIKAFYHANNISIAVPDGVELSRVGK
ncbi:MAG: mechanosensitive ion channel family protein [Saprospiraceae bacterium]|nr:mechanosensitive ion channel family protein [Saprospiraceae bacterium]